MQKHNIRICNRKTKIKLLKSEAAMHSRMLEFNKNHK